MEIRDVHYKRLQGKVYKIFMFFTEGNEGLTTYIDSLIYELEGLDHRLNDKQHSILVTVISLLEHFYDDSLSPDPDLKTIRREWLNCMSLLDKIAKYGDSEWVSLKASKREWECRTDLTLMH